MSDYSNRNKEMIYLRNEKLYLLQDIGNIYGISKERVRQIVGNTGNIKSKKTKELIKKLDISSLTIDEITSLPGSPTLWKNHAGKVRHITNAIGVEFEYMASDILNDKGISNKLMPFNHPFDILTSSGVRIDVKHTNFDISNCPSQKKVVYPTYPIGHLKKGKDCDYFFIFIPDNKETLGYSIFIIPSSAVPKYSGGVIRIPWPCISNKKSKWHKYLNRFDLLKDENMVERMY